MLQQFIDIVERMRNYKRKLWPPGKLEFFTLLDKIAEDMEIPKTPQETHFLREKWSHIRWMASKLAAKTFGDKLQQDIKQDTTITVSWGKPNEMVDAKKIVEEIQTTAVPSLPNS